jgi:hypothetical protein
MSDDGGGRRVRLVAGRASNYVKGFYQCLSLIGAALVSAWLITEGQQFDTLLGSNAERVAIAIVLCAVVMLLATWKMPGAPTGLLGVVGIALLIAGSSLYFHRAGDSSASFAKVSRGSSTGAHRSRSHPGVAHAHAAYATHRRPTRTHDIHATTGSSHRSQLASAAASTGAADSSSAGSSGAPEQYVADRPDQSSEQQSSSQPQSHETHAAVRETRPSPPPTVEGSGHAAATPTVEGGSKPVSEKSPTVPTVEGSGN